MQPDRTIPLTEQDAILIAKAACQRRGWPWQEPVIVQREPDKTYLRTNGRARGCNAEFVIDNATGRIIRERFARR